MEVNGYVCSMFGHLGHGGGLPFESTFLSYKKVACLMIVCEEKPDDIDRISFDVFAKKMKLEHALGIHDAFFKNTLKEYTEEVVKKVVYGGDEQCG